MRRLSSTHTRLLADIVGVLLPNEPRLDREVRRRVQEAVTGFVVSQVEALPSFLGLTYRLAMTAFAVHATLRHRRPFHRLDPVAKLQHLESWDESSLAPMRNYVKLVRSCALLAYYDHPTVRMAMRARESVGVPAAQLTVS